MHTVAQVVNAIPGWAIVKGKTTKVVNRTDIVVKVVEPPELVGAPLRFVPQFALTPKELSCAEMPGPPLREDGEQPDFNVPTWYGWKAT